MAKSTARGKNRRSSGEHRFPVFHDLYPRAFVFVGALLLFVELIAFPSALRIYQEDTELRAHGVTTSAVVERVDSVRHTGRRSSWYEYIPVVSFQIDGREQTASLRDYSSKSTNEFPLGKKLTVMYDPSKPYDAPGIKDNEARSSVVRNLVQNSILGALGAVLLPVGIAVVILRGVRKRRERRSSEESKSSS